MKTARIVTNEHCQHAGAAKPQGLVLMTIVNSMDEQHSFASALLASLPPHAVRDVCQVNLVSAEGLLAERMSGHKAAIIIDTTKNSTSPGTVSITDLSSQIEKDFPLNIGSGNGVLLADQIRLAKTKGRLPKRIVFFGVEVDESEWHENYGTKVEAKLPQLAAKLAFLITKLVETLQRDA